MLSSVIRARTIVLRETSGIDIPEDLHRAVSFVKQISNLHDKGFRELTPGLSGELDTAIEVLRKYRDFEPYVENMLGSALSLRESMPEIKFI